MTNLSVDAKPRLPREIGILIASAFAVAIGYGIVAPALPQYARSFGVTVAAASAVVSVFAGMRLLFAPLSGHLVQRRGERPVYLWGVLIVAASTAACALAQNYWQLMVFRALGGIGSTMFTVSAMGLIIRISPPAARARVAGLYWSSFLVGSVSGPLIGSALISYGLRVPFAIYAVTLVIAAAVVFVFLRRSHLAAPEASAAMGRLTLRSALGIPAYRASVWTSFANGWALFGVRMAIIPLFIVESLHREPEVAGVALTVYAIGNVALLIPAGKWADIYGRRPFLIAGAAISGLATAAMGVTQSLASFLAISLVAGLGSGLMNPAMQAAVADVVGTKTRGGPALAAYQMAADLGAFVGPIAAGQLAEWTSYSGAFALTGAVMVASAAYWLVTDETLVRSSPYGTIEPISEPIK